MSPFTIDAMTYAALLATVLLMLSLLWARRRSSGASQKQPEEALDTVQSWPPQVVRVMTLPERQAYEILRKALPGHLVLAQVPLSRFISVPTSHAYSEWLHRAGRLNVDLLVCDTSSRVVAVVEVRPAEVSAQSRKRHQRLSQVLKAAGVTVHEWREGGLPSLIEARKQLLPRATNDEFEFTQAVGPGGHRMIPVAEIEEMLSAGDEFTNTSIHDPVPSGFFDDFDSIPMQKPARA